MNQQAQELRLKADIARTMLMTGKISVEQARGRVQPYIDMVNDKAVEIAEKYQQTAKKVSAAGFLR